MPSITALFSAAGQHADEPRGRRRQSSAFGDFAHRRRAASLDGLLILPSDACLASPRALSPCRKESTSSPVLTEVLEAAVRALQWSPAKTKAAAEKLMLAGVSSVDEFEAALADGGVELNSKIHALGYKAFRPETIERFQHRMRQEKSEYRWRRLLEARRRQDQQSLHGKVVQESECQAEVGEPSSGGPVQEGLPAAAAAAAAAAVTVQPGPGDSQTSTGDIAYSEDGGSECQDEDASCAASDRSPSPRKPPMGRHAQVWDYPLSRSEKQLRLAHLYENECLALDQENRELKRYIRRSSLAS